MSDSPERQPTTVESLVGCFTTMFALTLGFIVAPSILMLAIGLHTGHTQKLYNGELFKKKGADTAASKGEETGKSKSPKGSAKSDKDPDQKKAATTADKGQSKSDIVQFTETMERLYEKRAARRKLELADEAALDEKQKADDDAAAAKLALELKAVELQLQKKADQDRVAANHAAAVKKKQLDRQARQKKVAEKMKATKKKLAEALAKLQSNPKDPKPAKKKPAADQGPGTMSVNDIVKACIADLSFSRAYTKDNAATKFLNYAQALADTNEDTFVVFGNALKITATKKNMRIASRDVTIAYWKKQLRRNVKASWVGTRYETPVLAKASNLDTTITWFDHIKVMIALNPYGKIFKDHTEAKKLSALCGRLSKATKTRFKTLTTKVWYTKWSKSAKPAEKNKKEK